MNLFKLQTAWESYVAFRCDDGTLVHCISSEINSLHGDIYAAWDERHPGLLFIVPDGKLSGTLRIGDNATRSRINAFVIRQVKTLENDERTDSTQLHVGDSVALSDLTSGSIICAPQLHELSSTPIHVGAPHSDSQDYFILSPVSDVDNAIVEFCVTLAALISHSFGADELIRGLETLPLSDDHIAIYFELLSLPERAKLAARLLEHPQHIKGLIERNKVASSASSIASDIWLEQGLLRLSLWLKADRRPSSFPEYVGENLDSLALSTWLEPKALGQSCTVLARRGILPRKKTSIVCSVRNEGVYLIDWIAYHRAMGFEEIFVYTNDNDDGSDPLLDALCRAGLIRLLRNEVAPSTRPQYKSYGHAHQILPDSLDYEWTAAIDLDEFIRIDRSRFENLDHFLDWQNSGNPDCIQLPWVMCSPNRQVHFKDEPILKRAPSKLLDRQTRSFKSIFKMRNFAHNAIHFPLDFETRRFQWEDTQHYPSVPGHAEYHDSALPLNAWIDHHYYKSLEEYVLRKTSNTGDQAVQHGHNLGLLTSQHVQGLLWWFRSEPVSNDVDAETLNKTNDLTSAIRSLPGIEDAHRICVDLHQKKSEQIRSAMEIDERFQTANSPENALFNLLMEIQ